MLIKAFIQVTYIVILEKYHRQYIYTFTKYSGGIYVRIQK